MDERINEFLDSEEPEGYMDASTHHYLGRFSFEEPMMDEEMPPLLGDLIFTAMANDPVLNFRPRNLRIDPDLEEESKRFWQEYRFLRPVIHSRISHGGGRIFPFFSLPDSLPSLKSL